jgi:hypothetical protein
MSIFDKLLQKWKHTDPEIRAKAVSKLNDQELLTAIAEGDTNEEVRLAAVKRLTDQKTLNRFARGSSPLNIHAVEGLTDREMLIDLAVQAESPRVRELAVEKIDDKAVLQRIAACDVDAWVRFQAKKKCAGSDRIMHDVIKRSLANLEVAERKAADVAEFFGSLDDVCEALIKDRRFRINAGMSEGAVTRASQLGEESSATSATAGADLTSTRSVSCATFLASRRNVTGEPEADKTPSVIYEINVWRGEQNTFKGEVKEKRLELTNDLPAWNRSSHESGVAGSATRDNATSNSRRTS